MKKLLTLALLASCSASMTEGSVPLQPLPTTGKSTIPMRENISTEDREDIFIVNLGKNYPGAFPFSNDELIDMGWEFCESLSKGSTHREIRHFIGAIWDSEQKVRVSRAALTNAVLDLCPHHLGRL